MKWKNIILFFSICFLSREVIGSQSSSLTWLFLEEAAKLKKEEELAKMQKDKRKESDQSSDQTTVKRTCKNREKPENKEELFKDAEKDIELYERLEELREAVRKTVKKRSLSPVGTQEKQPEMSSPLSPESSRLEKEQSIIENRSDAESDKILVSKLEKDRCLIDTSKKYHESYLQQRKNKSDKIKQRIQGPPEGTEPWRGELWTIDEESEKGNTYESITG